VSLPTSPIASRMRNAAASARSGVANVAITASPMVLTTAPFSAATMALSRWKWLAHQLIGDQVADARVKLGRALQIGKQNVRLTILRPWSTASVLVR